jgi:hypothetical protein
VRLWEAEAEGDSTSPGEGLQGEEADGAAGGPKLIEELHNPFSALAGGA